MYVAVLAVKMGLKLSTEVGLCLADALFELFRKARLRR
jgi:hypothetical protein